MGYALGLIIGVCIYQAVKYIRREVINIRESRAKFNAEWARIMDEQAKRNDKK